MVSNVKKYTFINNFNIVYKLIPKPLTTKQSYKNKKPVLLINCFTSSVQTPHMEQHSTGHNTSVPNSSLLNCNETLPIESILSRIANTNIIIYLLLFLFTNREQVMTEEYNLLVGKSRLQILNCVQVLVHTTVVSVIVIPKLIKIR